MLACLSQGNVGGVVVALAFMGVAIYGINVRCAEESRENERRRAEEAKRMAQERQEAQRRQWEESEEGQAYLEQQRREAAEMQSRMAAELLRRQAEQERQRRQAEEDAARNAWNAFFESKTMEDITSMSGFEFEKFLARLLPHLGYGGIILTPVNDQGGDILCTSTSGDAVVVQAKRWKGSLGNSVVQELLGAMLHYGCVRGMIITNSRFTVAAKTLAGKDPRILLCDGCWLEEQIHRYIPAEVPPFDWERYKNEVEPAVK